MLGCSTKRSIGLKGSSLALSEHEYYETDYDSLTCYTTDYQQTFKINAPHGEKLRGVYFNLNKRAYVFLIGHETLDDIIATCVHEDLHGAIDDGFHLLHQIRQASA